MLANHGTRVAIHKSRVLFLNIYCKEICVKEQIEKKDCSCKSQCDLSRRNALKLTTGVVLGLATGISPILCAEESGEQASPAVGDFLADAYAEGAPVALCLNDIKVGEKPIIAYPFNPKTGVLKDESRLNKVLLLRVDSQQINSEFVKNSADGVLAYSGVCTHKGCDITTYDAANDEIVCFCHFSKFQPTSGGEVLGGPASRNLPILPIKLDNETLVVAGTFLSKPGSTS